MKNPFRCLFKPFRHQEAKPVDRLTEDELSAQLNAASDNQKNAARSVQVSAIKQVVEADYIRETLNGVLARVNERERNNKHDG